MVGVRGRVDGARVVVDKSRRRRPSPLVSGTATQMRGLWAKNLLRLGATPTAVAALMKISRMQLHRDIKAATAWLDDMAEGALAESA